MFVKFKKEARDSWSQVTAHLGTMFTYTLRRRKVESFEDLWELFIVDRLKQLMPSYLRSLLIQQEWKGSLKVKNIAELGVNFEESLDRSR